jgi:hypothetical protein
VYQPAWEFRAGLDQLELGFGHVGAEEEVRAEGASPVAVHEQVDVADVVGLEDDGQRRWPRIESLPDLAGIVWRREWIQNGDLSA